MTTIRTFVLFLFLFTFFILHSQSGSDYPDLGLNGTVTWIDSTHVRVEYDWTDNTQLLDWLPTEGSILIRENGSVTVSGGSTSYVRSMVWKQGIKCSRIIAEDAYPLSSAGHLNFYTNLESFTGSTWLPDPGMGAVLAVNKNFWEHDGVDAGTIGAPYLEVGVPRDYIYNASDAGMTIKSSVDEIVYSFNAACLPALDRKIALGGWGGNTKWGKITIEGQVAWKYVPVPSDVINIQSNGAVFAPVIEVVGTPVIEWIFDDSTTSSSSTPVKDYGTTGSRRNYLKVTPWSALVGINVGYDAADGGYGDFAKIPSQKVLEFKNLNLAKESLRYLCANYNLITELDLTQLQGLEFVELYKCTYLAGIKLDSHPVLERLCVEDCHLDSLNISGCPALEDLRGALNAYPKINWGSVGQSLWHICIRDNPQMTENIPDLTRFPLLKELLIWNTNQTGTLECHNAVIQEIDAYNNHFTSADLSGCTNLRKLSLSGSQLTSLNLGTANLLSNVKMRECGLTTPLVDYVLKTLDEAGRYSGFLDLSLNAAPSLDGFAHLNRILSRGWTVENITGINENPGTALLKMIRSDNEVQLSLNEGFISGDAGLFDLSGKPLLSKTIDSDLLVFDISSLPAGLYFILVSDDNQRIVKKFIKP